MCIQSVPSHKVSWANATFEYFLSTINCCKMIIHINLLSKLSATNVTFELFLSFMNCYYMSLQITLLSKPSITNQTFQCFFFSITKCYNMIVQDNLVSKQISYLNCFFSSWTCFFKSPNVQTQHHKWHIDLLSKLSVTNVTFELFLSFMDKGNMGIQIDLLSKLSITNVTFELLPSFMDYCNMYFQIGP